MIDSDALTAGLRERGVDDVLAARVADVLSNTLSSLDSWMTLVAKLPELPINFVAQEWLYETIYEDLPNRPAWVPSEQTIANANVTSAARELGLPDYFAFHKWSVQKREAFWKFVINRLGIQQRVPFTQLADTSRPTSPRWLIGARLNIVESCFLAPDHATAIIESDGQNASRRYTYAELKQMTARVANGLAAAGIKPGDTVAVVMPMSFRSIAIYLGVIAAGAAVVSIADSFAEEEVSLRLRLAGAKMVFTQDAVAWGAKRLPLYLKMQGAKAPKTVVLFASDPRVELRAGDVSLDSFLSDEETFSPVARAADDPVNILFSSGTTGEPKVIPWDQTTPIKCATDAHFHHDLHPGDVTCWPTSLGWMMGPWLVFATLINRGTMALYMQAPTDAGFGRFVQEARVTMLGLVPSLVRAWRQSHCMEGLDWSAIRAFSSSGECSNPSDMLYLMHLAGYRPIIEYCGGTEIGGGYITGTVVQACTPSTFTTPALGLDFVLLDDNQQPAEKGEVFLVGPSIGLSTRLLNRDHDSVYFANTPADDNGRPLRRHGDELERLSTGGWRVAGRSDDTMNLGGIKVGCAEIERALNRLEGVQETAAVAISPRGGGPSRLVIFVVPAESAHAVTPEHFKPPMQQAIRTQLNPLFHIDSVRVIASLPRTASNKVMRRELRAMCSL